MNQDLKRIYLTKKAQKDALSERKKEEEGRKKNPKYIFQEMLSTYIANFDNQLEKVAYKGEPLRIILVEISSGSGYIEPYYTQKTEIEEKTYWSNAHKEYRTEPVATTKKERLYGGDMHKYLYVYGSNEYIPIEKSLMMKKYEDGYSNDMVDKELVERMFVNEDDMQFHPNRQINRNDITDAKLLELYDLTKKKGYFPLLQIRSKYSDSSAYYLVLEVNPAIPVNHEELSSQWDSTPPFLRSKNNPNIIPTIEHSTKATGSISWVIGVVLGFGFTTFLLIFLMKSVVK